MADKEEWIVDGYQFGSAKDATQAKAELLKIQKLEDKMDYRNPHMVYMVYHKAIENRIFKTPIGYEYLRKLCLKIKNNQLKIGQNVIKTVYPFLRNYKIEIEGEENIPRDSNVIFVVNHSTSHDIFTAYEFLSLLKRRGSVMVATDCLNKPVTEIFNISNATLLDRRNKEERKNAVLELSKKIIDGNDGVIFGEGTWNLHPILPMHIIQNGASKISSIAQVPIIPTIMEYIEVDNPVNSDAELFKKCIIRFGKPISNNYDIRAIEQSNIIREEMSLIRKQIWNNFEIKREKISEIEVIK